ncbi:Yip1 family protein [Paractinoplanes maris]|uniref:Yip1 family protein n=1 Tax=Paractinoplanes maris TaxID=1734446 RepID=UPI00202025DC|nr:Yip1 family protein [Actinoplanes maris]
MSDGEFLGYAGALAVAGLLFLILAVLGLGQGLVMRVLDVLLGLAFLGYAGYLMVVAPDSPFTSWFVFVTPALGLAAAVVARRRSRARIKRLEEAGSQPYAGQHATNHAERQPFPSPPPPLDPSAPAAKPDKKQPERPSTALPSGLPPSGLGERPVEAEPRPPRPSGLPKTHAEPDYRARHGASGGETADHDYAGGRHRANGAAEPE